ncbi:MAG: type II toxin-antitoxin system PemK/MazF family toxin [Calditrichaeota bacterium]|nr:MAG: type II toxin-antitoxin system PemK/MazF family toxin [Calditrichota bacterium]
MKRGEIRYFTFKSPDKKRPVLILTRDSVIPYLNKITVAPITTTIRDISSEVLLGKVDGMPKDCAINFDHIQTVDKTKIGKLITSLTVVKLEQVSEAVNFALDLQNPKSINTFLN